MNSGLIPNEEPTMRLRVVTPLFTGKTDDKAAILKRLAAWNDWLQTRSLSELHEACGKGRRASISPYYPGLQIHIPHKNAKHPLIVTFPDDAEARVPKGLVTRLHLMVLLERIAESGADQLEVIFGCIDGSGAFKFDSLKLLLDVFNESPQVDVVFGRRPPENSGMMPGRKEIEEFEQYLLFLHRADELRGSFPTCDLTTGLLPDGQAGCWGFRLNAAYRLPLTASSYEIEFDLLASAIDAGLTCAFTEPLLMSDEPRLSLASETAIPMSLTKIDFIQRKLRIGPDEVIQGWVAFKQRFAKSATLMGMLPGYEDALIAHCSMSVTNDR